MTANSVKTWMENLFRMNQENFSNRKPRPGLGKGSKNNNWSGHLSEPLVAVTSKGIREVPVGTEYCIFREMSDKGSRTAVSFLLEDAVLNVREDGHAIYTPHPRASGIY